jgi:hypothetical protein
MFTARTHRECAVIRLTFEPQVRFRRHKCDAAAAAHRLPPPPPALGHSARGGECAQPLNGAVVAALGFPLVPGQQARGADTAGGAADGLAGGEGGATGVGGAHLRCGGEGGVGAARGTDGTGTGPREGERGSVGVVRGGAVGR